MTIQEAMLQIARQAKAASRKLAGLSALDKSLCLEAMASALEARAAQLEEANRRDLESGARLGLSAAMLDRLRLDDKRIAAMARGLREVASLPDPVGRLIEERVRPNGLRLQKVATPIGVIVIIYESRAQCDGRRRESLLQVRQRHDSARRQGGAALESRDRVGDGRGGAGGACRHFPNTPFKWCRPRSARRSRRCCR